MKPIIIVTPYYTHTSNGIRALHDICHTINSLGGMARLLFLTDKSIVGGGLFPIDERGFPVTETNTEWNTPILQESERHLINEGIVIYPEVVKGNPLKAPRVARWVGNKEGVLRDGEGMDAQPDDFMIAHSKVLMKNPDFVLYYSYVNPCFNDEDAPPEGRSMNATYIGKGYLYGDVGIIKKTLLIERKWPISQEQLAFLLKRVACFYTWDAWSQTNVDAVLCGCVPFFLRYTPFLQSDIDDSELGIIPRLDRVNSNFDLVKFSQQRAALIDRIAMLQLSWKSRVLSLMFALTDRYGA